MVAEGVRLCRRLDGVRAEPVAVGLLRSFEGQRGLKRGPGLACRAAYSEFATSPYHHAMDMMMARTRTARFGRRTEDRASGTVGRRR